MTYLANVQSEIAQIERDYILRDREKVLAYLEQYYFLVPLLIEARPKIEKYFPGSQVFLEVVVDPELIGVTELFAFIGVSESAEEVSERLDKFDEEWWLDESDRAQDKFTVSVRFQ